jgi:hypothetical protein
VSGTGGHPAAQLADCCPSYIFFRSRRNSAALSPRAISPPGIVSSIESRARASSMESNREPRRQTPPNHGYP